MSDVRVTPATPERWESLGAVFGFRANNPNSCWCQRFRRRDANDKDNDNDNRSALHDEVQRSTTPIGLIAHDGTEPVGWTRAVPRSTLPGILENQSLARLLEDDQHAWWVTCFVVRRERRGAGIGVQLLRAAVEWAADHDASVLDGHPVDTEVSQSTPSPSATFTGTVSMFRQAGFTEIGRTYPSRAVMRRDLTAL